jgi:hypothetical protein
MYDPVQPAGPAVARDRGEPAPVLRPARDGELIGLEEADESCDVLAGGRLGDARGRALGQLIEGPARRPQREQLRGGVVDAEIAS